MDNLEHLDNLRDLVNSRPWQETYLALLERLKKQKKQEQEQTLRNPLLQGNQAVYLQGYIDGITSAMDEPIAEIKRINPDIDREKAPGY